MAVRIGYVVLIVGVFLWMLFSYPLAVQILHYASYTSSVLPDEVTWSIMPIHDELWRPMVHFKYTVNGKQYHVNEIFQSGRYLTPYAAEEKIKELRKTNEYVWYNSKKIAQGTMERFFPLKKIVYSLLTLILIFYSAWLSYFLVKKWIH